MPSAQCDTNESGSSLMMTDLVGRRDDEAETETKDRAEDHPHPDLPHSQPDPGVKRVRGNGQRAALPQAQLVPSSMVITLFAPRSPHDGGAPAPTRIVITGNGGASSGHFVWQSLTTTRSSSR